MLNHNLLERIAEFVQFTAWSLAADVMCECSGKKGAKVLECILEACLYHRVFGIDGHEVGLYSLAKDKEMGAGI